MGEDADTLPGVIEQVADALMGAAGPLLAGPATELDYEGQHDEFAQARPRTPLGCGAPLGAPQWEACPRWHGARSKRRPAAPCCPPADALRDHGTAGPAF